MAKSKYIWHHKSQSKSVEAVKNAWLLFWKNSLGMRFHVGVESVHWGQRSGGLKGETLFTGMWKCVLGFLMHSGLATTSCSAGSDWDIYRQPSLKGISTGFKYTTHESGLKELKSQWYMRFKSWPLMKTAQN